MPLHEAAISVLAETAGLLLAEGAKINTRNNKGMMSLNSALDFIRRGVEDMMKNGASLSLAGWGRTE